MDKLENEMNAVLNFVREGEEHGTIVEAIHWAIKSALSGEAKTVEEAVALAESEWYK